jgi:hypothetical protein
MIHVILKNYPSTQNQARAQNKTLLFDPSFSKKEAKTQAREPFGSLARSRRYANSRNYRAR